MARGRMLNKKISLDIAVNKLSCDTARLLFTWIIGHLDANGCFYGNENLVKNLVFPLRNDVKPKKVGRFLDEMEQLGLIVSYKVKEEEYLFYPQFDKNQPGLRPDREAKSDIPAYSLLQSNVGINQESIRNYDGIPPSEVQVQVEEKYKRSIREVEEKSSSTAKNIFQIYEENIGELTPLISDELKSAEELFGEERVKAAIKEAARANKKSWRYIAGILRNWQQDKDDILICGQSIAKVWGILRGEITASERNIELYRGELKRLGIPEEEPS